MRSLIGLVLLLPVAAASCARGEGHGGSTDAVPSATVAPLAAPSPRRVGDGSVHLAAPPRPAVPWATRALPALLAAEAARRPRVQPRAEAVLSRLQRRGVVTLRKRRQALAAAVGAAYCLATSTTAGVGLLVCEHVDEAAARRGRETLARLVPGGEVSRRGQTVLLVNPDPARPAQRAAARRLTALFLERGHSSLRKHP